MNKDLKFSRPFFLQIPIGDMDNFSYLIGDYDGDVACIDPGWDSKKIFAIAQAHGVNITKILLTHVHYDHSGEAEELLNILLPTREGISEESIPKIFASACIPLWKKNSFPPNGRWVVPKLFTPLTPQTPLHIGKFPIKIYDVPGHQSDHLMFEIEGYLFTGDTLFIGRIGRTDIEDSSATDMKNSLEIVKHLPDPLIVCPGHDYGEVPMRSLGEEKLLNPYL